MPLPRAVARTNRVLLNRILGPFALRLPAFGVVEHRGRRSGRLYRTPVNIFRQTDGYVVALTYGVGDWVRNVLAADECTLVTRGHARHMVRPRLVHDEQRRAVPPILRFVGALGRVSDFLYLQDDPSAMRRARRTHVPGWIRFFSPAAKALMSLGVPMGPDVLLTVRGRKSGLPRSTPVAVAEIAGRRWLVSPFGDVDWARNLRVAGRGTITTGRSRYEISARELSREEAVVFYRDVLEPYLHGNAVARWIVRNLDRIPEDPVEAARRATVFEVMALT